MTDKIKTWLVDETGVRSYADGAEERDRLIARGLAETVEPVGGEFVWCRHPDIAVPAKLPANTLEAWTARGWAPGAPPEPDNYFSVAAPEVAAPTPVTDTKPKSAAGGTSSKEN